jgi:hypothetical protein
MKVTKHIHGQEHFVLVLLVYNQFHLLKKEQQFSQIFSGTYTGELGPLFKYQLALHLWLDLLDPKQLLLTSHKFEFWAYVVETT